MANSLVEVSIAQLRLAATSPATASINVEHAKTLLFEYDRIVSHLENFALMWRSEGKDPDNKRFPNYSKWEERCPENQKGVIDNFLQKVLP